MKHLSLGKIFVALFGLGIMALTGHFSSKTQPFQITSLLSPDHPTRISYENYLKKFDDEKVAYYLIKRKEGSFSDFEIHHLLKNAHKELKNIYGVQSLQSLENGEYLTYKNGHMALRPFMKDGKLTKEAMNALNEPFWKNTLIDESKTSLIIAINFGDEVIGNFEKNLMATLTDFKERFENTYELIESHFIGTKIAKYHFLKEMQLTQSVILPLLLLLLGLLIFYLFRSLSTLFWFFYIMLQSYAITLAVVIINEGGMGPYNGLALFFVLIVATSDLIHYFSAVSEYKGDSFEGSLQYAKDKVYMPCLLTTVTTVVGFMSLMLNEMAPVRYFGFYCAFGSIICFVSTFYLLPKVLTIFKNETRLPKKMALVPTHSALNFVFKKPIIINVFFLTLTIVLGIFATRVQINDDFYNKFYDDHPLTKSVNAFSENFNFVGSVDLLIKPNKGVLTPKMKENFKSLENELSKIENVSHTKSFYGILDHIENAVGKGMLSSTENEREKVVESIYHLMSNFGFLDDFLYKKSNELKLSLFLDTLSSKELSNVIEKVNKVIQKDKYINAFHAELMGFATIRTTLYENIIINFITSFGISFIIIFFLFLILFRSLTWALLAMLPNTLPLLFIAGIMGMLNVNVENNLVLMVCITLGIAVDDTIHFLYALRAQLKSGNEFKNSVRIAFDQTSRALLGTTAIFVLSFPCFFLADLKLFIQVGFFVMASLLLALVADFILLPALFLTLNRDD